MRQRLIAENAFDLSEAFGYYPANACQSPFRSRAWHWFLMRTGRSITKPAPFLPFTPLLWCQIGFVFRNEPTAKTRLPQS